MREIAGQLNDAVIRDIAIYYERLPPRHVDTTTLDAAAAARGRLIATTGAPDRDIPACAECHGPSALPKNRSYPMLSGQHVRYLTSQLMLLKERRRGGSPHVNLMHAFVDRLTPSDMTDAAQYFAAVPPGVVPATAR